MTWPFKSGELFPGLGLVAGVGVREKYVQFLSLLTGLSNYDASCAFTHSVPKGLLALLCSPGTLGGIAQGTVPSQLDLCTTVRHD